MAGTDPSRKPSTSEILDFLQSEGRRWLRVRNVVGVSIAEKRRAGAPSGEMAVVFDVKAKLSSTADVIRAESRPIPAVIRVGDRTLPTDVVEAWPELHDADQGVRLGRIDPVRGGVSLGNEVETGTLGAVVWHTPTSTPVGLTNWHVLASRETSGVTYQPGPEDDGPSANRLGSIGPGVFNDRVDAALTSIETRGFAPEILALGIGIERTAAVSERLKVVKSGKSTAVTYGVVTEAHKLIGLGVPGLPELHDLIVCKIEPDPAKPPDGALSLRGDSGSCWMVVGEDGRPTGAMIGLHVGGDGDSIAYACHADAVFAALQIEPLGDRAPLRPAVAEPGQPAVEPSSAALGLPTSAPVEGPMTEIIDVSYSCGDKAAALALAGVRTIVRYYSRDTIRPSKRLSAAEASLHAAAGLRLCIVHEGRHGDVATNFDRACGVADAQYVLAYGADVIGQPSGSAIYFGVDFDASRTEIRDRVLPYFQGVADAIAQAPSASRYRVGVYGSGATCKAVLDAGLAELAWLAQSTGWSGYDAFDRSQRWAMKQAMSAKIAGVECDPDMAGAGLAIGDFVVAAAAPLPDAVAQMWVNARSGLRLRAGPGVEFDSVRLLPFGTGVRPLKTVSAWTMVDLEGDGVADGFVSGAYLTDAVPGTPITLPGGTAAIGQGLDAVGVPELIRRGGSAGGLKAAREAAAAALSGYPHNGCAVHLSALLRQS
ncbi:MAG: hypothetical protein JWO33_552, partial [Caulobacteraceae bacterium]|nr:hypothetical protein [Caulobacteraceae bacterium]